MRQERAAPAADTLHRWLILHRQKVPDGSATAKAIDYSLKRWAALTRYVDDGNLPIDNNWVENRPARLPLAARTGCSPGRCVPANAPPPS